MNSIVIDKPNSITLTEVPLVDPPDYCVRIRVKFAGICSSDIHIWRGHNPFARYPRVIGHEICGAIDAVGKNIATSYIGKRVVVDPVVSCGYCYSCLNNRPNVCISLHVIGVHLDGGFSDFIIVPLKNIYEIPVTVSDKTASLVEPYSVAANITSLLKPHKRDLALIYGAGPIGLVTLQVLKKIYGLKEVLVVDPVSKRRNMARESGASLTFDNSKDSLISQLGNVRPSLIIDSACDPSILKEASYLSSPAAKIGLLGFSNQESSIAQKLLAEKEISIFSSRLNNRHFPLVLDWMERNLIDPEILISHFFPLREAERAMMIFENQLHSCCKILLDIADG